MTQVPVLPSITSEGQAWLRNFATEDVATARLILDSLRVPSEHEIRVGLLDKLNEIRDLRRHPILALPIRSLKDFAGNAAKPVVYEDFLPAAAISVTPGSEAIAANIIRDMIGIRTASPDFLSPTSTIEDLRSKACRMLVFVGDYSGSGSECIKYVKSWLRNPTIRSWRSFGWLEVHVVLFAASSLAMKRINRANILDRLHIVEPAADFHSSGWKNAEIRSVVEVCDRYTHPRRRARGEALGYGSSKGLFVMQHTVPNNLPAIFLQPRGPRNENWGALFPNRVFPVKLQRKLAGYKPRNEFSPLPEAFPDRALLAALVSEGKIPEAPYLMVLSLIAGHSGTDETMAGILATSTMQIKDIRAALRAWGLLDGKDHLTDAGWETLRQARMRPRHVTFSLIGKAEPYYPQQLRGVT
jgi:hypothetical protein